MFIRMFINVYPQYGNLDMPDLLYDYRKVKMW
jgi:hypothetical protein